MCLGVSVCVLCSGVLVLFVVLVALGCGVVVWELYSEREHLADEMSRAAMSCGGLVFESCPCDFVDCFCCSLLEGCDRIFCGCGFVLKFLRAHGGCLGIKSR